MLPPPNLGTSKAGFFGGDFVGVVEGAEVDGSGIEADPTSWFSFNAANGLGGALDAGARPANGLPLGLNPATGCVGLAGADCGIIVLNNAVALAEESAGLGVESVVEAALKSDGPGVDDAAKDCEVAFD